MCLAPLCSECRLRINGSILVHRCRDHLTINLSLPVVQAVGDPALEYNTFDSLMNDNCDDSSDDSSLPLATGPVVAFQNGRLVDCSNNSDDDKEKSAFDARNPMTKGGKTKQRRSG